MNIRYILGDTETTGAGTDDKVCEIAWAELDANLQVIDLVQSLIDPERTISFGAMGVHGITHEDVEDAPTIEEFFSIVRPGALTDGDVIFIAHNAKFDEPFFKPFISSHVGTLCTLRLAKRFLLDAENYKLTTLRHQYGLHKGNSHRADDDVLATVDLLRLICMVSGLSINELLIENEKPLMIQKMPFGKHKDRPLSELVKADPGYIRWLLGTDIDNDLRMSVEAAKRGEL